MAERQNLSPSLSSLPSVRDMNHVARPGNTNNTTTIRSLATRITPEPYVDLVGYLQRLRAERFFGQLVIDFIKGDINVVRVEQSLKPWDLAKPCDLRKPENPP